MIETCLVEYECESCHKKKGVDIKTNDHSDIKNAFINSLCKKCYIKEISKQGSSY